MSRHDWARLARRVEVPVSPNRTDIATAVLRRLDRLDELERKHQRREPAHSIAAWADEHPAALFLLFAFDDEALAAAWVFGVDPHTNPYPTKEK